MEHNVIYGMNVTEQQVSELLRELGFSCSLKGYYYIKQAIMLAINEGDDFLFYPTKYLYPRLANDNNTVSDNVERCIRNAIEKAFLKYIPVEYIESIFKYSISSDKGKPTNAQFLLTLAEYIKYTY